MQRIFSICLFLCSLAMAAFLPAQQYGIHAYRQADGLGNISVTGLTKDTSGFLWVGTENGVYRFLGTGFQRFGQEEGITDIDIRDVLGDSNGTVWVGTESELFRWDGMRFHPAGQNPIHVPGHNRMAIEDAHHLLLVQNGRLYRFEHALDGREIALTPVFADASHVPPISTVSVVQWPAGGTQVWLGSGKKLFSFQEDKGSNRTIQSIRELEEWGSAKGLPEDDWRQVVVDRENTIWAAGIKNVFVLPDGANRFVSRNIPGTNYSSIYGHVPLLEDPQGRMLAPAGKTLARWTGKEWRLIGRDNGLKRVSAILGMVFDSTGNLFLASRGDGLNQWPGYGDWEGWDDENGLPSPAIWSVVFPHQGRVFIGTEQGPAWIDPERGVSTALVPRRSWAYGRVSALNVNRDGSLWAVSYDGDILRLDPRTGRVERTEGVPNHISWAFQSSSGEAFLFGGQKIYRRTNESAPFHLVSAAETGNEVAALRNVMAVCESPDHSVWITSDNQLVQYKKGGQWRIVPVDGITKLSGTILGLGCDTDGSLWVTGDQTGTWHLQPHNGRLQATQLKLPDALSGLSSLTVLKDRRGWIWLGTELGLVVWNGSSWRHVTEESGLIWNDTNQGVLKEAPDGSLWIGTNGGLSHLIHPEHIFRPIPTSLSLIRIASGARDFTGAGDITVREGDPPLSFQMASPTMHNRAELRLKFRMVDLTPDWADASDGFVVFPRLRAGSYNFIAMACDTVLDSCSVPVKVDVHVLPAWWNSPWFRLACVIAIALLLLAIGQLYARHLQRRSKELERLVNERTHELEQSRELLRVQATYDGLTGMLNRTNILTSLTEELERARRERRTLVVALADLDHFKTINDQHGHLAGDEALRQFAKAVRSTIRPYDHCGRYGGEEFLLVLTNVPLDAADQRLKMIHHSITELPVKTSDGVFSVNCSVGAVIASPTKATNPETLLAIADQLLYEAKASGRNRIVTRTVMAGELDPA